MLVQLPPPSFNQGFARSKGESAFPHLWDGLEGCWEFNLGVQGDKPRDFSGRGRHLSVTAGFGTNITWVMTPYGWGMQSVPNAGSDRLSFTSIPTGVIWTWETRFKMNSFTDSWESMFSEGANIGLYIRAAQTFNFLFQSGSLSSIMSFNANQWYHCVVVAETSQVTIYVDNKQDRQGAVATPSFSADSIFNDTSSETMDGVFAYQRFWKRALTPGERTLLFQGASPLSLWRRKRGTVFISGGAGAQTISPSGIASAEAFGTPRVNQQIRPTGIASAEVVPSPRVNQQVRPGGIASAEAFGTPVITVGAPDQIIIPAGIASLEAFGTARVNQQIRPTGIASAQAFGTPTVSSGPPPPQLILPTGIASQEAFGIPRINQRILVVGIPSGEAFGTPTVSIGGAIIWVSYGAPFLYTANNWVQPAVFYLEAFFKNDAGGGDSRARLFNVTDSTPVANSVISTSNASYERVRSPALTLLNGKEYRVQFGGDPGTFKMAKLLQL